MQSPCVGQMLHTSHKVPSPQGLPCLTLCTKVQPWGCAAQPLQLSSGGGHWPAMCPVAPKSHICKHWNYNSAIIAWQSNLFTESTELLCLTQGNAKFVSQVFLGDMSLLGRDFDDIECPVDMAFFLGPSF